MMTRPNKRLEKKKENLQNYRNCFRFFLLQHVYMLLYNHQTFFLLIFYLLKVQFSNLPHTFNGSKGLLISD